MAHYQHTLRFFALTTLAAFVFVLATPFAFAAISTDKDDYAPGETVTITGDGYWAGESISIEVVAPYGFEYGTALANGSGEFSWSFVLPADDSALGSYSYTATGDDSGIVQGGTFTDGNVKVFPLPVSATFTLTKTVYDTTTCTGTILDGPDVVNGVSDPSGETTGVGNTDSVKLQAAAFSDQGGAFIGWTSVDPIVSTTTTVVANDTICVIGFTGGGNRSYYANYGVPPITGTITLEKTVTNNNGGTAVEGDFQAYLNGNPVPWGVPQVLEVGNYTASEDGLSGYDASDWGGDCGEDGAVTLEEDDELVCTITNDDIQPTLTVTKTVVNDNGGAKVVADFPLFVDATPVTSGISNGFDAGSYTVSETTQAGYSASDWGGDCAADGSITLEVGEAYECTITNDDEAPTITLIKSVTNDDGGSAGENDFGLTIGGTSVNSGDTLAVDANTPVALDEVGLFGYSFVSITGDEECPGTLGGTATLNEGEDITCTITNDDQPGTLIVQKILINDDGGSTATTTFSFQVNGGGSQNFEADGENELTVDAGMYSIVEDAISGYSIGYSNSENGNSDCQNLSIGNGETVTCTITNNDVAVDPPVPPTSCAPAPAAGGIRVLICNSGTINNATLSDSSTGGNAAGGSNGGNGGNGGVVDPVGNHANGGSAAGNGGNGGNAGAGGLVRTGNASSRSGTTNALNSSDVTLETPATMNSSVAEIIVDNTGAPGSNVIANLTRSGARSGENVSLGSSGGSGGSGGAVDGGSGDFNNGGATSGAGGSGGSGGQGGVVETGRSDSLAGTNNWLNSTRVRVLR